MTTNTRQAALSHSSSLLTPNNLFSAPPEALEHPADKQQTEPAQKQRLADDGRQNRHVYGVAEQPRLKPDATRKDNIKFVVGEWDNAPALMTAEDWTGPGHILIFEVWNYPDSLNLRLYMGPGPEAIREGILEAARRNPEVFAVPRTVSGGWVPIFIRHLLDRETYEKLSQEQREQEIRRKWGEFLEDDLPRIENALKREAWIWEPVRTDDR